MGVLAEFSDLLSILSRLDQSLKGDFNSGPQFPPGVAENLSTLLEKYKKDLINLQATI